MNLDLNSVARICGHHLALVLIIGASLLSGSMAQAGESKQKSWRDSFAALPSGRSFSGMASFYSTGQKTASGARFNPHGLSAAHRTLPFGTKVRVSHPSSGRSVIVTINDRGPFIRSRVLDLSLGAARALGITGAGVARVRAEVM